MPETVNEHEAAHRLGLLVEEVVYRLDYGQVMGRQVDGGWSSGVLPCIRGSEYSEGRRKV